MRQGFSMPLGGKNDMGGIEVIDLYIDISQGVNITELINNIVSSGNISVDVFVQSMNERFGQIAQFSYQSMQQDGQLKTSLCVESQVNDSVKESSSVLDTNNHDVNMLSYSSFDVHSHDGYRSWQFSGDKRHDNVEVLNFFTKSSELELGNLSQRWPAKTQVIGAAFYYILKTYKAGNIYVLDKVKLSNGMSYNLSEAWEHRNYLHPEECAGLGAVIAYAQTLNLIDFESRLSRVQSEGKHGEKKRSNFVYFIR